MTDSRNSPTDTVAQGNCAKRETPTQGCVGHGALTPVGPRLVDEAPAIDLRRFPSMPLHVLDLLDSDLFLLSNGDEFKAAFALICASWLQVPAGSLPSSDSELRAIAGTDDWDAVRPMALRNWVLGADGRLHHPVVAARVMHVVRASSGVRKFLRRPAQPRRIDVTPSEWERLRAEVFERDAYTCQYCGQNGGRLELDHVVAVVRGGLSVLGNLLTACQSCNRSKGAKRLEDWKQ